MALPDGSILIEDKWRLSGAARQVGAALSGRRQVVANVTPRWMADLTFRVPFTGNRHFIAEAWIEGLRDGAVIDAIRPGALRMSFDLGVGVTYDGGVTFDAGVTYDTDRSLALDAAAAQFATSITVDSSATLTIGKFIWIADRMYRVTSIAGQVVGILPPLRAAAAIGASVEGNATINMVLAAPDGGDLRRSVAGHSDFTVSLIEDLTT